MELLFAEIWFFLLLAFLLGMFVQWFFCCRNKSDHNDESGSTTIATPLAASTVTAAAEPTPEPAPLISDTWRPMGFETAPVETDELKRIKGIGMVIQETLNGLGIYQFKQIASWDDNNVAWVENFLAFPGRINREDWINQAKTLAEGGSTEFASRVDKGDVNYDS